MGGSLTLNYQLNMRVCNGGLFLSAGRGMHPNRIITSYELIFVRSGSLDIAEEDRQYRLGEGDYLILYPRRRHWGLSEYSDDLSFYWFHFYLETAEESLNDLWLPQYGKAVRPETVSELFNYFIEDQESGFSYDPFKQMLALLIFSELTRPSADKERVGQAIVWASQAHTYIRMHFAEQINRALIADAIGCSPDYLGRVYLKVYRKHITDSIHDFRIKRAAQMIAEENETLAAIAEKCGYPDLRSFRQQFKLRKGMTPKHYREKYFIAQMESQYQK